MKFTSLLLIPDDQQWQLVALQHESIADQLTIDWPVAGDRDQLQHIQNLKTTLQNWGYQNQPAVIALPDAWCICSHLTGNHSKQSRQNVLYHFEARWPLAIEDVVADYLPGKDDTLGVCATIKQLKPIIDAVEELDLNLQAICPKAILALQHYLATNDSTSINQAVWANGKAYHWFNIADRKPTRWTWLAPDEKSLVLQAKSQHLAGVADQHVQLLDFPQAITDQIKALPEPSK